MGLIDVLNGMQNGPRGQRDPSATQQRRNVTDYDGDPRSACVQGVERYCRRSTVDCSGEYSRTARGYAINVNLPCGGGGLGDLLSGGLGGLLAGGAAGSVLSGGLNDLLKQFQQNGHGDAVNSWVGTGPNKAIPPKDLA